MQRRDRMQLVAKRDNFVSPNEDGICEAKCFESRFKENMPQRYHKNVTKLLFNATKSPEYFWSKNLVLHTRILASIAYGESIIRIKNT